MLDRLGDVAVLDFTGSIEIGEGACDAEDFVVGAGAETKAVDGILQQGVRAGRERAVLTGGCALQAKAPL